MSAVAAFSGWLFLLLSLSSWTTSYAKETRIVCYYTNWSVYRPGDAKFTPQNINPYLCTHLIYAFGGFTKENTLKPFDKYQDIEKGGYAKFTGLKTYNKNLKTMLAIGGWNEGSTRFSPLVANEERRKELVKNSIKFLRQNHFDGLDLDWEYPSFRDGGKPRDRDNYANFVQELREEFERESEKTGRPRLLLTMAVPAGIEYINKGYDIPKLTRYLDWMNILSYDFHSAFEPAVNHHAPLYALEEDNEYNYDAELNIDYTIKHYLKLGADPSKLVLGIPTYGRSYTLFNPDAYEIGSPADGPGTMGEATRENGYLAYYEICDYVKNQDWEVDEPNPKAMGPYAFKDNQWVGYDDEKIVRKKAEYVAENGLGGIMFWAIDNDDFRGNCHGKSYPLIEAGKEALLQASGITEDNLIAPPAKPIKSRTRTRTKNNEKTVSKYDEKEVKVDKLSNRRRNNRVKSTVKEEEVKEKEVKEVPINRRKLRRNKSTTTEEPTTHSSLKVVTPSYTTPEPPSTPDMGGAFKCEEEGFFAHPKDCKKYFWCLSGAGDSGLIAHQFTCPAGLYFNKAADSCDYTQNVLCNKKLQKPKSTTTSSPSATSSSTTTTTEGTTSRVPPKITAATSKYTIRFSTTTAATEEEYDDEYEDEEDEPSRKSSSGNDSEEDPQVIKELIDLIKKAGGIEHLERQLQLNEKNADSSKDKTTESTVGKSLYERVLSKALKTTLNSKKATYTGLRNSRGPQSETTNDESTKEKINRGTLQYTSISRNRPSSAENVEKDQNEEITEKSISEVTKPTRTFKKPTEYVNIRRGRVSSTSEVPETNSVLNRNKILGEGSFEEEGEETEDEINEADANENEKNNRKTFTPQYVNIRRQRPSTTEGPSTSKYVEIRRGTTESTDDKFNEEETTSKYQTIKRGTTIAPVGEEDSAEGNKRRPTTENPGAEVSSPKRYVNIRQSTTNNPISTKDQGILGASENGEESTTFTPAGTPSSEPTSPNTNSSDDVSDSNQEIVTSTDSSETTRRLNITQATQRPSLFISRSPTVRSTTEPTTQTLKVSQSNIKFRPRTRTEFQTTETSDLAGIDEKNIPTRRGFSRFKSQNTNSQLTANDEQSVPVQTRRRIISTTERVYDEQRSYRPSELADLSSLTSVDFGKLKEFNNLENRLRRRPARISTSTSSTTTTTEKLEESLKTSSRTLPLARKLINTATFGKSRRVFDAKNLTLTKDEPTESTILSTQTPTIGKLNNTNSAIPRTRRIIRRFRTTTTSTTTTTTTTTTPPPQDQEPKETKSIVGLLSQNNTGKRILFKQKLPKLFPLQENKEDEDSDDSFEDNINDEEENIKLSESNIRESSQLNAFDNDKKSFKVSGPKSGSLYRGVNYNEQNKNLEYGTKFSTITESVTVAEPRTESQGRTRKVIRKFRPSEATNTFNNIDEQDVIAGRKRKIVRKLRPVSRFNKIYKDSENVTEPTIGNSNGETITREETDETNEERNGNVPIIIEETSSTEKILTGRYTPKRILNPKIETNTAEHSQEIQKSLRRYKLRPNTGAIETSQNEGVSRSRLQRIKTNNNDENSKTYDYETRTNLTHPKYLLRFKNNGENISTKGTDSVLTGEVTTAPYSERNNESNDTSTGLDDDYIPPKNVETTQLSPFENNDTSNQYDSQKVERLEVDLLNETIISEDSNNEAETCEDCSNDNITTTEQSTDLPETSPETSPTPSTSSTESLLKRLNSRRQEYRPKFNRAQTSTSTEATEPRKLPRYKSFTRKPITSEITGLKISEDKSKSDSPAFKPRFNRYRFRTTESTSTTEFEIKNETNTNTFSSSDEITKESQIKKEIHLNNRTEDSKSPLLDGKPTTESETITEDIISTQETPIYTTEETTENTFTFTPTPELLTSIDDATIKTDPVFEVITPAVSHDTVMPTEESTIQEEIIESTTVSPMTTNEIETNNEISGDNEKLTTNDFSLTSDTTTDVSSSSTTTTPSTTTIASFTTRRGKSILNSFSSRPNFIPSSPKLPSYRLKSKAYLSQLTTETSFTSKENSTPTYRRFNTFSDRSSTTQRSLFSKPKFPKSFTRNPYLSTLKVTSQTTPSTNDEKEFEEPENQNEEEENVNEESEDNTDADLDSPFKINLESGLQEKNKFVKQSNIPVFDKKPSTKVVNIPIAPKIVESSQINKELSETDILAIKQKTKNLFTKQRKMNVPFVPKIQSSTEENQASDSNTSISETVNTTPLEMSTRPENDLPITTEDPTTLHHIFAELDGTMKTTTEELNTVLDTTTSKMERLFEVNRIVQVKTKEEVIKNHVLSKQKEDETNSTLDKIGEVNRVTVIKVVDKDGKLLNITSVLNQTAPLSPVYIAETTTHPQEPIKSSVDAIIEIARVQEIPARVVMGTVNLTNIMLEVNHQNAIPEKPTREERKFEIFGSSKISNFNINNKEPYYGKAEIIDGISHINIITPRPLYHAETSTIALEGLFQTKKLDNSLDQGAKEEVLETEHSRFVNVRVLHPDESVRLENARKDSTKVIPIKLLKQDDEEVTMRAKVVEVKPVSSSNMIKITPIQIEMFKKVATNLPYKVEKQNTSPT